MTWLFEVILFSSNFKLIHLRSEKPICAQLRLSEVSPTLPLKQFHRSSDWRWTFLILFRKFVEPSSFHASLLQAIDGVMSLALCPQVPSPDPQHFRSSETQATCDSWVPLPPTTLPAPVYPLGHFPSLLHVQGSTPTGLSECGCRSDTCQSGLPIPFFTLCSKLIESLRMLACVAWLSPLEAIQRRVWVTVSTSNFKVEVETV